MDKLISRQAAITAIVYSDDTGSMTCRQMAKVLDVIKAVPSAQPEIIRCKDCKYCRKVDESEYWCYGFCSPARLVRKDDFCSYGCKYE